MRPAAFFDRDGVLNVDRGYVYQPEQFEWIAGAREAVRRLNELDYLVFVVTNQAGIARGYYTEETFRRFTRWIDEQFRAAGAHLDAVYYCPHHPTKGKGKYAITCSCRKPAPGLLLQALAEWDVDRRGSFLIGDKQSDLAAAAAAGIRAVYFEGGNLLDCVASCTKGDS
jgi:D-glycero-D-manno-heptose 1,7-bisphosphate phosphatase